MTDEQVQEKIEEQNEIIELYFEILQDVEQGEKISIKALSVYQLQGSGFVQANNGSVKGVMRSKDKMVVDRYSPVNEDLENIDKETAIRLEDRTIVGIDQQAASQIGNIISRAMQHRGMEKNQGQNSKLGIDTDKDLEYIG